MTLSEVAELEAAVMGEDAPVRGRALCPCECCGEQWGIDYLSTIKGPDGKPAQLCPHCRGKHALWWIQADKLRARIAELEAELSMARKTTGGA